jgi:DNA-binding NarL/FixJ family response regulator
VSTRRTSRAEIARYLQGIPTLRLHENLDTNDALQRLRLAAMNMVITRLDLPFLEAVRAIPHCSTMPIHLVADRYEQAELERALNLGVTSFLVRPLRGADLIFAVCGALRTQELA